MTELQKDVVARQIETLQNDNIDALIVLSPENFNYISGFTVPSQAVLRWRHAAVVITASGRDAVLCVDMEEETVRDRLPTTDIYVWQEFSDNAMPVLAQLLRGLGVSDGKLAIETDYIPAKDFNNLQEELPRAQFTPGQAALTESRAVKTTTELDWLKSLSYRTDTAIQHGFDQLRAGDTELELAGAVIRTLYDQGIDRHQGLVVATGPRSQYPNLGPTNRRITTGDVIRFEVTGQSEGYHAGVCRTAIVGEPPPEVSRVWEVLTECRDVVLGMLKPGESTARIYQTYVDHFNKLNYAPISFVGHGIGAFLHEQPYLDHYSDHILEEGMVFGIEPLVYFADGFGAQIKDTVSITGTGCSVLSNVMDGSTLYRVDPS